VLLATLHDIDALPVRQRTALLAVAVADRPHADVARELELSEGGLRQLLLRARTALRATATALTPPPIAAWLAAGQGSTAARVSELAAGAGGAGVAVKVGMAVVATGALVGGVGTIRHEVGSAPVGRVATRPAVAGASAPSRARTRETPIAARAPAGPAAAGDRTSGRVADQRAMRRERNGFTAASPPVDSRSHARSAVPVDRGPDPVTSGPPPAPSASLHGHVSETAPKASPPSPSASVHGHVSKTAPKASPPSTKPNTAKPGRQTRAAQTPKAPPGLPKGSSKATMGKPEAPKSDRPSPKTSAPAGAVAPGAPNSHRSPAPEDRSGDDGS
jgi:hypothetical protein